MLSGHSYTRHQVLEICYARKCAQLKACNGAGISQAWQQVLSSISTAFPKVELCIRHNMTQLKTTEAVTCECCTSMHVCVCVCVPGSRLHFLSSVFLAFSKVFLPAQGDSGVARVDPGAPPHTAKVVLHDWSAESRCSLQDNLLRYCHCCVGRGPPLAVE